MNFNNIDDKSLVIVAVFMICIVGMFRLDDPASIINNALTGLFGVAVGKAMNGNGR